MHSSERNFSEFPTGDDYLQCIVVSFPLSRAEGYLSGDDTRSDEQRAMDGPIRTAQFRNRFQGEDLAFSDLDLQYFYF